jgi:hypothetical protein
MSGSDGFPILRIQWRDLPAGDREALTGKLVGLWGAPNDETAFDSLAIDKQQALLLILGRMQVKQLWQVVRRIENVYGDTGVGLEFVAWPLIKTTLAGRSDFTRKLARHSKTSGGFYERGRAVGVLHFLYQAGSQWKWHVHFDLYSPVHSVGSALKHLRHEVVGNVKPDWKIIRQSLISG